MKNNSIVKDSKSIYSCLLKRIEQLKLRPSDIIKDAEKHGKKIESASLSKYLKHGNVKGALSEELIIWLSFRWGIDVFLMVGTPKVVDGKLKIELPEYDEEKAIAKLKLIFG
jgi:hypothetical protein